MSENTPQNLKDWLAFPPVAAWSDAEKFAALEAQQALSILDADKAAFVARLFVEHFEEINRARPRKPWEGG